MKETAKDWAQAAGPPPALKKRTRRGDLTAMIEDAATPPPEPKRRLMLYISPDLYGELEAFAKARSLSLTKTGEIALRHLLDSV